MTRERPLRMLLGRLGSAATGQKPAQLGQRHYSKLAPPKTSAFRGDYGTGRAFLPIIQRKLLPSWAPARAYSSPTISSPSTPSPTSPTTTSASQEPLSERPPSYELTFTCKPCKHRSTHTITKQGYHYGAVLIMCPECKNRHIISDHLGIFADRKLTIEDLMRQKGELVKRGTLGDQGDVEFWDDGTETTSAKVDAKQP